MGESWYSYDVLKKNGAELYEDNIVLCNASGNAPGNICRYTLATFKDSAARPRYSWRARDVYLFSLYRNMNVRKIKTPQTVTHGALIYGGSGVSGYALRKKNSLQNCAMTQHMLFSAWGVTLPPVNRASRYRPLSARTPISVPLAVSHLRVLGGRFLWFSFFGTRRAVARPVDRGTLESCVVFTHQEHDGFFGKPISQPRVLRADSFYHQTCQAICIESWFREFGCCH